MCVIIRSWKMWFVDVVQKCLFLAPVKEPNFAVCRQDTKIK
jgi:hypothetical protein